MTDLFLDEDFDVALDDRNDLSTVDGRDQFEQTVAVKLTAFMYRIPGESDFATLKEKIRLEVSRVVRSYNLLDELDRIVVERHEDKASTVVVEIIYSSSASFDFNLNL